ncbi:MAG: glycosyltransferase, partial [Saprospiraceae bacterium]
FARLAFFKIPTSHTKSTKEPPTVSIVICAKNEAKNLSQNLPRILNQNYHSFEVIVVNDDSTDETANILLDFQIKKPNLRIIKNYNKLNNNIGKKTALAKGIAAAKNEVLLLTDADCYPNSLEWLSEMQALLNDAKAIGLGYSPYRYYPGMLNRLIRFETVYTAIQYFSFALAKLPYMGVGRNLIYKKQLFQQVDGFQAHRHVVSGDDDLFINQVANKNNTAITILPKTFMYSEPKRSWRAYYRQKTRHFTTGIHYKFVHKSLLAVLAISHFFHYTGGIILLLAKFSTIFVFLIYVVRMVIILIIYAAILKRFQERNLLLWIPFLDVAYLAYYIIFAPVSLIGKTDSWT